MIFFVMFLLSASLQAQEKSAFEQTLERDSHQRVEERWVQYGDRRYREVIYEGSKYYLRGLESAPDKIEIECREPEGSSKPLLEAGVKVYRRTKAFVSLLQESCRDMDGKGHRRKVVSLDPAIGFSFPDQPKSAIQDKKVMFKPQGVDFSGTW